MSFTSPPKFRYVDYRWHTPASASTAEVSGSAWHPCWAHVQQMSHGPSPASSLLHPTTRRTMKMKDPVRCQALRHNTQDIWKYGCGLVLTSQDSILNHQCGLLQTNGHTLRMHQSIYRQT